ncbi:putative Ulp1 protease family catalytic domain, putative transposase, Ptta/En/Spm, plant [Rosa chinensis]|uniref:Putative Ulp1 protease family catalytic domain, putative transposase, Ptta/En/Spm, plant n=1 Tax=Rosa chinensis TaxID=74649 RepID=A0A2P6PEJ9_ROSCH|nr:putative Ulp1 protease family catalytic domain, putative transposase, Ptta/En/Spm, plant [Rosa chinensis]
MYKVLVKKALGKKFKVTYTDTGNLNGSIRHTLQSYIGMLARTKVPINIVSWPNVDGDLKNKLWLDVKDTFKVAPESKKLVLTSAGTKWRAFKTMLTRKYVLPYLGKKKKLRKPPSQYAFVGRQPWRQFVKERTTEKWLELHNKQSERVRKRKYHHRLSRKGYIGLEEELKKTLPEGEVIDCAIMWKKARQRKDGDRDEKARAVVTKIDDLLEKKSKGELEISGSSDVLSQALETLEHSGRVRGVGGFINPSTYFKLPKLKRIRITKADLLARDRERDRELEETKKMLTAQQAKAEELLNKRIAALEVMITGKTPNTPPLNVHVLGDCRISPISDKGSIHDRTLNTSNNLDEAKVKEEVQDCEVVPPPTEMGGTCELAVDTINNIVAFGTVFEDEDVNRMIHGVPLKEGCVRVSVDGAIQAEARLPFLVEGEMGLVGQAIGSHVAWPEELVIRRVNKKKKRKMDFVKQLFDQAELNSFVPKRCKLLYKHAKTIMSQTSELISTVLDDKVFGLHKELFILTENVTDLLEMKKIGQGVIAAYMAHLHETLTERDELDTFTFIDPAATYNCERSGFGPYLVDRLKEGKADRIFFMPYNPGCIMWAMKYYKEHWILTIIWEDEVYILDPLPNPVHYTAWETAVMNAVKSYNAEKGRANKVPKLRLLPGVPKQPGGIECGYYVMRYMKDIINDDTLSFSTKWAVKTRKGYTQQQLDEVRMEVANYLQTLL